VTAAPTARSLAWCRRKGWHAGVVEKWLPYLGGKPREPGKGGAGIRRDLFGCFDLVVVAWSEPAPGGDGQQLLAAPLIVGVQACAAASHAARVAKVAAAPVLPAWIAAGGRAEVWSWSKKGAAGKRKLWSLRRQVVSPAGGAGTP